MFFRNRNQKFFPVVYFFFYLKKEKKVQTVFSDDVSNVTIEKNFHSNN
jgi:hypothetical protein